MTTHRIIVVGGGGSGAPVAARLAAHEGIEVVLLEAGPAWTAPRQAPATHAAVLADAATVRAALPDGPLTWTYPTRLLGRDHRIARGRILGGSTAVNGALFLRAHPDDFADWAAVAGQEWSYDRVLPALRRLEHDRDHADDPVHGDRGPMPVERAPQQGRFADALREAALGDLGHHWEADKNAGGAPGFGPLPRNTRDGERWSTARAYLDTTVLGGLTIRGGAVVERVLIVGGRAIGVEVRDGAGGLERVLGDEVILSAGAIETPRLLYRSGIGGAPRRRGDTPWVASLPGVGAGLSDHPMFVVDWDPVAGSIDTTPPTSWFAGLHWSAPGGTTRGELELLVTARPRAFLETGDPSPGPFGVLVTLLRPRAHGVVHGPAADGPVIDYGYLTAPEDGARLREGLREALRLLAAPALAPHIAGVRAPTPELLRDDAAADAWIAARLSTALHSASTARMGAADDLGAVTDAHGRVHGVAGLRIADTSILPSAPSRGTAATAVLVGERIAELRLAEFGIRDGARPLVRAPG